jgi:hypothetical protein
MILFLRRSTRERLGAAIAALAFLTLFGGLGALGLWVTGGSIYDGMRARDWTPVPAEIMHVDAGTATFGYLWQERRYVSDRVGTFKPGGSTDLDDWEDRMDRLLSQAVTEKRPVTAYVNPQDPAEAMLDREIRWKFVLLIAGISFASFMAGVIACVAIGAKAIGWQARGAGVPLLKPRAREALMQWGLALLWNAFMIPVSLVVIPEMLEKGEWFPVVLLSIFTLLGLLIAWGAMNTTWSVFREGSPFNARAAT